jgi:hypothetical protein
VTHVDADHIDGVVRLLAEESLLPAFRDVWFNAYKHLAPGLLGARGGEQLTTQLTGSGRWNDAFGGEAYPVVVPDTGPAPPVPLDG